MIKKSAIIALTLLYTITVCGFTLNFHYCFNRLASFKIEAPASSCTKNLLACKMKCCKDKAVDIKVKDAHQTGIVSPLINLFAVTLPKSYLPDFSLLFGKMQSITIADRAPPRLYCSAPIFLKNQNFRI